MAAKMYTKVFSLDASHSGTHLEPQNSEDTDRGVGAASAVTKSKASMDYIRPCLKDHSKEK